MAIALSKTRSDRSGAAKNGSANARIPKMRKSSGLRSLLAYFFLLPALAIFAVFAIGPTVFTFVMSGFKWNWLNASQNKFSGLRNYQDMLDGSADPPFFQTLGVSAYFVLAMVVGGTALSLGLALITAHCGPELVQPSFCGRPHCGLSSSRHATGCHLNCLGVDLQPALWAGEPGAELVWQPEY